MTFPTPTGAAPQSFTTISGQNEAYYQQIFVTNWGAAAGTAYKSWNTKNPANTPYVNAQSFTVMVTAQGIAKAIASVGTFVGSSVPTATANAASNTTAVKDVNAVLSTGQFLSNLTNPVLWLRITKIAVGGIILIVGLAKLTGTDQSAGKVIKSAVKVAPLL